MIINNSELQKSHLTHFTKRLNDSRSNYGSEVNLSESFLKYLRRNYRYGHIYNKHLETSDGFEI